MIKNKLNTVQNGKGPKPRKNINWRNYWDSEYWDNLDKTKKAEKTVLKYSESDELISHS